MATKLFGIDYAWHSGVPADCFHKNGVRFVGRYLSPDPSKNISGAEYLTLKRAGIGVITAWESSASRATQGRAAGAADASAAVVQLRQIGAPPNSVIYFAVDFDSSPNPGATDAYFDGAASVLGKTRTGIYAGYAGVARHFQRGYKYAWQTYAWSGGRWDPRAQVRQYSNGHTLCGVSVDYDESQTTDYGQWGYVAPLPPRPSPHPVPKPVWTGSHTQWVQVLEFIRHHPGEFPNASAAWTDVTTHKQKAAALWNRVYGK